MAEKIKRLNFYTGNSCRSQMVEAGVNISNPKSQHFNEDCFSFQVELKLNPY